MLKQLTTWREFTSRLKDRFMFSSWRLDTLARFYNVSQDFDGFCSLIASLEEVRNTLYSANDGYAIGDCFPKPPLLCQSRVSTPCPGHTKLCVRELESQRTDQRHGNYAVEPRCARLHGVRTQVNAQICSYL